MRPACAPGTESAAGMLPAEDVFFLFDVRENDIPVLVLAQAPSSLPGPILLRLTPTLYGQFLFDDGLDFFSQLNMREKGHNVPESSTVEILSSLIFN